MIRKTTFFLIPPISLKAVIPPGAQARNCKTSSNTTLPFISHVRSIAKPKYFHFKLQQDSGHLPPFTWPPVAIPLIWATALVPSAVPARPSSPFGYHKAGTGFYLTCKWTHVTFLPKTFQRFLKVFDKMQTPQQACIMFDLAYPSEHVLGYFPPVLLFTKLLT